jgi:tRNA A-37 threonylcarbamoyl transferase component Bud32
MGDGVAAEPWGQGYGRKLRIGFVLDVAGYGTRSAPAQNDVQRRLPLLVVDSLADCGMDLISIDHEWTGDGINAVMPADVDPTMVLPLLIRSLAANLGADNARSVDRIRLRMAVGVGLVEQSAAGFGGPMIVDTNRLVGSAPLRAALAAYPSADLAVAISDLVHATVIRPGYPGIPGSQFNRVNVVAKEFTGPAWIWVSARQWGEPAYRPLRADDPREIGGYRIAAWLGDGPAARVYLGYPRPGGDWLAVKKFRQELVADADVRRRLTTGALAARVVHGAHIAHAVDADTESGRPWVASALVLGPSLADAVAETGPLPAAAVVWLTLDVARALVPLHDAGLAHQSVTPGNVLLEPGGPTLSDFAISKAALTRGATAAADDVFQLGNAAFYAATGRSPWHTSPAAMIAAGEETGEPDLTGCPAALLPTLQACLAADPERRPTAAEVLTMLTAFAGQRPRSWLPGTITARFDEYRQFPPEPAPAHRARFSYLRRPPSRLKLC